MTAAELMALSLGVSIAVAGIGGLAAAVLARRVADAGLKDRVWAVALWAPILPPLLTAILLASPAPVRTINVAPVSMTMSAPTLTATFTQATPPAPVLMIDPAMIGWGLLSLALLLSLTRLIALGVRAQRLRRLLATARHASPHLAETVATAAQALGLKVPAVRVSATATEALLAGLARPVLILPAVLAGMPDAADARAVIAHELAHLKRRDHQVLWAEEALGVALAFNPLTPLLRHRRAAAREEACDALALRDASPDARRAYARSLIDALRSRALSGEAVPALTFTGSQRSSAMNRLKAVLNPAPAAGRRTRLTALAAGLVVVGLAGAASFAVAAQREPERVLTSDPGQNQGQDQDGGLTLDEADGQSVTLTDGPWLNAAMDPIYKAVWPQACGYGSNADGSVFVHVGQGCTSGDTPNPVIQTLAGISPSSSPRAAYMAVKTACDARRPVAVAYVQGGQRTTTTVACAAPVAPPARQKDLEVRLTYEGVALEPGDTLEVALVRLEGGNAWRRSLAFDLTGKAALPVSVTARVDPELFAGGVSPSMKATLYGRDGAIRAVSGDRPLPMLVSASAAIARAILSPVAAARTTGQALTTAREAAADLTPEQQARYRSPTAAALKQFCGADGMDAAYCDGAMFGAAYNVAGQRAVICPPLNADGAMNVHQVSARGRPAIAAATPAAGQSGIAFVRDVMIRTFPCATLQSRIGAEIPVANPAASRPDADQRFKVRMTVLRDGRIAASSEEIVTRGIKGLVRVLDGQSRYDFDLTVDPAGAGTDRLMALNGVVSAARVDGGERRTLAAPVMTFRPGGTVSIQVGNPAEEIRVTVAAAD